MQRRLAATPAVDVVGSSGLMGEDEAGTLDALEAHREDLVEPDIAEPVERSRAARGVLERGGT